MGRVTSEKKQKLEQTNVEVATEADLIPASSYIR